MSKQFSGVAVGMHSLGLVFAEPSLWCAFRQESACLNVGESRSGVFDYPVVGLRQRLTKCVC